MSGKKRGEVGKGKVPLLAPHSKIPQDESGKIRTLPQTDVTRKAKYHNANSHRVGTRVHVHQNTARSNREGEVPSLHLKVKYLKCV